MEKITEKYYLGSNKNTLMLYEKKGEENYKKIGYYSTLDELYNSLLEKEIREDLTVVNNVEKIVELIKELKEFTVKYLESKN